MNVVRNLPAIQIVGPNGETKGTLPSGQVIDLGSLSFLDTLDRLNRAQLGTNRFNASHYYAAKARISAARRDAPQCLMFGDAFEPIKDSAKTGQGLNSAEQDSLEPHMLEILSPAPSEADALARNPKA